MPLQAAAPALIAEANFSVRDDGLGTPIYEGLVWFDVLTATPVRSSFTVLLGAGDNLTTLQAKTLAAVDKSAAALNMSPPSVVYGGGIVQLR
jgi:hypothetical protein